MSESDIYKKKNKASKEIDRVAGSNFRWGIQESHLNRELNEVKEQTVQRAGNRHSMERDWKSGKALRWKLSWHLWKMMGREP